MVTNLGRLLISGRVWYDTVWMTPGVRRTRSYTVTVSCLIGSLAHVVVLIWNNKGMSLTPSHTATNPHNAQTQYYSTQEGTHDKHNTAALCGLCSRERNTLNLNSTHTICLVWGGGGGAAAGVDIAIIIVILQYYSQSWRIKRAEEEELVIILVWASSHHHTSHQSNRYVNWGVGAAMKSMKADAIAIRSCGGWQWTETC